MTPREIVRRAVTFGTPPRLPRRLPEPYGSDFVTVGMRPNVDARPTGKGEAVEAMCEEFLRIDGATPGW